MTITHTFINGLRKLTCKHVKTERSLKDPKMARYSWPEIVQDVAIFVGSESDRLFCCAILKEAERQSMEHGNTEGGESEIEDRYRVLGNDSGFWTDGN